MSILILALFLNACSDSRVAPESRDLNFMFGYGVDAKNVLNTFEDTFTKDLILDGTATVQFTLSTSDFQRIKIKMLEINFFSYPDTFTVTTGNIAAVITPCSIYNIEVSYNTSIKHLHWEDCIVSEDSAAMKLRELIVLVKNIIVSHPEYSQLPPAKGGYL